MIAPCKYCAEPIEYKPGTVTCPHCIRDMFCIAPQQGPQTEFLSLDWVDIVLYGGAAFGGKTWALMLDPLRHVDNPRFGAVFFRRVTTDLTNEGGMWDESKKLYPHAGGKAKESPYPTWTFPSGAKFSFRHLESDETCHDQWKGAQIAHIAFDQLEEFTEFQFWYLTGRNRSDCGVQCVVRGSINPYPNWVARFLAPWLEADHPVHAEPSEVLWLVRVERDGEDQYHWFRDREEAQEYAKTRFPVTEDVGDLTKSVTFVPASVHDNKIGLAAQPGYIANLLAQNEVNVKRLYYGDWHAAPDRFFQEWTERRGDGSAWHVIPAGPVNLADKHYLCVDYGYGKPWACYLIGFDYDGYCTVYRELYGPGVKSSDQALAMIELLKANGVDPGITKRAGHDVFAAQRNSEGATEAVADIWRRTVYERYGESAIGWGSFVRGGGDPTSRKNRAAQWREYLADWGPTETWPQGRPGIQVMDCCKNLVRTLPLLVADKHNPEIVDTDLEDHAYDAIGNELEKHPGRPEHLIPQAIDPMETRMNVVTFDDESTHTEEYEW